MYRLLYIWIVALLFPNFSQAQTTIVSNHNKLITYSGKIVDNETGEALPFAQVNHIYKLPNKDSLIVRNLISDKDGRFEFQSPRVMNNRIEVICLGYKILTRMLSEAGNQKRGKLTGVVDATKQEQQSQIYDQVDLGILKLTPDVQQLDEVVVKARIKLFEMSGDTLMVFPKNIKQFEGETLADILKRLPNFYVDAQGNIYVNGKKIERAMLNNKHIFGEDVKTMVTSIMAKEAGLIKVYDEIDETSEILKGKEFASKRKVMNVITFKDFNQFKGGEIHLEAGMYANRDGEWEKQTMHKANGKIGQYAANFRTDVTGNSQKTENPQRKQEAGTGIHAEISSPDLLKLIGVNYDYGQKEQEQESRTEQHYFPTTYFESQIVNQNNNTLQHQKTHNFELNGKYIKKSKYSLIGSYLGSIENEKYHSLYISKITKDGEALSFLQRLRESDNHSHKHNATIQATPSLGKLGSTQLHIHGTVNKRSQQGIRMDTTYVENATNKGMFSISNSNSEYKISSSLHYHKGIGNFMISYHPHIFYVQQDRLYWVINRENQQVDSVTSQNQIQKDLRISNRISNSYQTDQFQLLVDISYHTYNLQLEELFPISLSINRKYHTWNGKIQIQLPNHGFQLAFDISDHLFSPSNLSSRLKDNNPMELQVGNPNLKIGKNYNFSSNISIRRSTHLFLQYQIVTNPILQSRRYFETNTLLPEFGGYEALAGAVLITPINAKRYNQFSLDASSHSTRGAILVKSTVNYDFKNPETDLLGEIFPSYEHRTNGSLALISNFSSAFRLDLTNRVSYNYSKIKAENPQKIRSISNNLAVNMSVNPFYRMLVNVDYKYHYNYNYRSKQTKNQHHLDASINYRIFSNRKGIISVNAYNLFNTKSSFRTTSSDLYIQNTYRPENSTLFSVSFRYKFGVEQ